MQYVSDIPAANSVPLFGIVANSVSFLHNIFSPDMFAMLLFIIRSKTTARDDILIIPLASTYANVCNCYTNATHTVIHIHIHLLGKFENSN